MNRMTLLVFPIRTSCVGCTFSLFTLSDLGCLTSSPFSAPKRDCLEANNCLPINLSYGSFIIYRYEFLSRPIWVCLNMGYTINFWPIKLMRDLGIYSILQISDKPYRKMLPAECSNTFPASSRWPAVTVLSQLSQSGTQSTQDSSAVLGSILSSNPYFCQ